MGAAAPAGYLGDAVTLHKVVGGTHGNAFSITDSAGNPASTRTELFSVSGKIAGPFVVDKDDLDLGHAQLGSSSGSQTVTVRNVGATPMDVGLGRRRRAPTRRFRRRPDQHVHGQRGLAVDATCTVQVAFKPPAAATAGNKSATLASLPRRARRPWCP